MATLTGALGSVTVGDGPSININEWEADLQQVIHDDTNFASAINARTKRGGMAKLVGRASGWAKVGTTPGIGTFATEHDVAGGTFNLITQNLATATGRGYTFTGLMSFMTVDVVKAALVAVSFTFQSQGAVTEWTGY